MRTGFTILHIHVTAMIEIHCRDVAEVKTSSFILHSISKPWRDWYLLVLRHLCVATWFRSVRIISLSSQFNDFAGVSPEISELSSNDCQNLSQARSEWLACWISWRPLQFPAMTFLPNWCDVDSPTVNKTRSVANVEIKFPQKRWSGTNDSWCQVWAHMRRVNLSSPGIYPLYKKTAPFKGWIWNFFYQAIVILVVWWLVLRSIAWNTPDPCIKPSVSEFSNLLGDLFTYTVTDAFL